MPYDLAAQYRRVVAELLAARKVVEAANAIYESDDLQGDAAALGDALNAYDQTPKAVLNHQPDSTSKEP